MIQVFLVEDEIIIRESIQRMIPWKEYGYELVGEASDGEMALPMIREQKPDLVITDIKMPFMDGLSLISLVKKELPNTKIVIISGYDDFSYAQKAIELGVEQYLLKPISKNKFIQILEDIREKYIKENQQKNYYEQFEREKQQYEQHSRQDFFASLVQGNTPLQTVYNQADQLHIDIMAQSYNILLFSMSTLENGPSIWDQYSEHTANLQQNMEMLFQDTKEYVLFRYQLFSYAVLIKGEKSEIENLTEQCVAMLKQLFSEQNAGGDWFICTGRPVERLSLLSSSYESAMKAFALRYMENKKIVRYDECKNGKNAENDSMDLQSVDVNALNPDIIRNFLSNGLKEETKEFVHQYMELIGENALKSRMFRQYLLLNIHFNVVSFLQKIGYKKEVVDNKKEQLEMQGLQDMDAIEQFLIERLNEAISLREEKSKNQYKSVVDQAVEYINQNFMDEDISLNKVARVANVSANHFSALFSQEMHRTFVEYLTDIRMKKAKELLRCTSMRSGRIALEVGYKDAHYFSFLFKKTQKMTPSQYRNRSESRV